MNSKSFCLSSAACILVFAFAGCAAESENIENGNETSDALMSSEQMSAEFPHCVVEAVAVPENAKALPSAAPAPKCFRFYAEATTFATKGRVKLPRNATPEEVDDAVAKDTSASLGAQSVVIAREYLNAGFSYPSLAVTANSGCSNGNRFYSTMPSGWNDVISSALIYGGTGCFHAYHYEHANFGGAMLDTADGSGNMGAMNDKTSSILWTR